jgi:putative oxidoreductase
MILSFLRIVVGLLLFEHGTQKFFHFPPPDRPMGMHALTPLMTVAGCLELIGGFLLVLGLFTRVIAFVVAGEMAVAYFMAHAPGSLYPIKNHGELAVVLCFVFLYLAVAGGGNISVDAARRR